MGVLEPEPDALLIEGKYPSRHGDLQAVLNTGLKLKRHCGTSSCVMTFINRRVVPQRDLLTRTATLEPPVVRFRIALPNCR